MKPSTTFASVGLPLGSVPHFTDTLAVSAILTPYKLVIVATMPVLRTHFKLNRPSGVLANCTNFSGSAAWHPSVQAIRGTNLVSEPTKPTLAFTWGRQLYILEIERGEDEIAAEPRPAIRTKITLFKEYEHSESIVAIQWSTNDTLCLLTASHQFLLFDIDTLSTIGQCDLVGKQLCHHDLYSTQLRAYFELREAEYVNQLFTDDYGQSLQSYKGRTFILGVHDISMGSLTTWTDRLLALIGNGHHIRAIRLLLSYYDGSAELRGLGLPLADIPRQQKLRPKVSQTILASVKYAFASEDLSTRSQAYHASLLSICFESCALISNLNLLFEDIFELYQEEGRTEQFLSLLSTRILDGEVVSIPPFMVQHIMHYFMSQKLFTRMEDIICHLDPRSLDIHQLLQFCKQHNLFNAMTYVYTECLFDYVAPMTEYFRLIKDVMFATRNLSSQNERTSLANATEFLGQNTVNAVKVYSFLSMTLTGKIFPTGSDRPTAEAEEGKTMLYDFLFSGSILSWPLDSVNLVTGGTGDEPTFPYLRLLLLFDCPTFLACLEEAFEDSFLNDPVSSQAPSKRLSKNTITRQFIVNILLDVMSTDFSEEDLLYLYMFIARSVPKFPQFILLSGSVLQRIMVALCEYTHPDLAEDCELSIEYLLSIYKPSQSSVMLDHYRQAGFYRVLKSALRSDRKWNELFLAHLEDKSHGEDVFDYIHEVFGPSSMLFKSQKDGLKTVLLKEIDVILQLDPRQAATTLAQMLPEIQEEIYHHLADRQELLQTWLSELQSRGYLKEDWVTPVVRQKYIRLLCENNPQLVLPYIMSLDTNEIDVSLIVDDLERREASDGFDFVDSIVQLMSIQGQRTRAIFRLMKSLEKSCSELETFSDIDAMTLKTAERCSIFGAKLCRLECQDFASGLSSEIFSKNTSQLQTLEHMWVMLLTGLSQLISKTMNDVPAVLTKERRKMQRSFFKCIKDCMQDVCHSLLDFTMSNRSTLLISVLRSYWANLAESKCNTAVVRELLTEIFNSHQYYAQLLALAGHVFALDRFGAFQVQHIAMQTGWLVENSVCSICGLPLWESRLVSIPVRERQSETVNRKNMRQAARLATITRLHGLPARDSTGKKREQIYGSKFCTDGLLQETQDSTRANAAIVAYACGHATHLLCTQSKSLEDPTPNIESNETYSCCEHKQLNTL